MNEINSAIKKGLAFLQANQSVNGSFPTLTSDKIDDFRSATLCHSNFASAIIYLCLASNSDNEARRIKNRIADYLLTQKSEEWTFNYWADNSEFKKLMPYPDDLDDTSCALAALYQENGSLFSGEVLGVITSVLTRLENNVGGPYKTWLVEDDADSIWQDIDLAVNCNLAYFLKILGISLPKVNKYIAQQIKENKIFSPYYPTMFPMYYFISRCNPQAKRQLLKHLRLYRKTTKSLNVIDCALFISALDNLGININSLSSEINLLLKSQSSDGSWPALAFYAGINPLKNGKKYYEGSKSLTTAFCIEALIKYKAQTKISNKLLQKNKKTEKAILAETINNQFTSFFMDLGDDIHKSALNITNKISRSKNGEEAVLMPYFFAKSLSPRYNRKIEDRIIAKLCMANLCGWVAYTIYDDFYDAKGDPKLLSIANISSRKLTEIYANGVKSNNNFAGYFNKTMGKVDYANFKEISDYRLEIRESSVIYQRIADFGDNNINIAEKSLGHIIGPIYILNQIGFSFDDIILSKADMMLRHYIVAKQLHDDAHDWEEDLRFGRLTPVIKLLFEELNITSIKLGEIEGLKIIFWDRIITDVCECISLHLSEAKSIYSELPILAKHSPLKNMILDLELLSEKTLAERKMAIDFIAGFEK